MNNKTIIGTQFAPGTTITATSNGSGNVIGLSSTVNYSEGLSSEDTVKVVNYLKSKGLLTEVLKLVPILKEFV